MNTLSVVTIFSLLYYYSLYLVPTLLFGVRLGDFIFQRTKDVNKQTNQPGLSVDTINSNRATLDVSLW